MTCRVLQPWISKRIEWIDPIVYCCVNVYTMYLLHLITQIGTCDAHPSRRPDMLDAAKVLPTAVVRNHKAHQFCEDHIVQADYCDLKRIQEGMHSARSDRSDRSFSQISDTYLRSPNRLIWIDRIDQIDPREFRDKLIIPANYSLISRCKWV